MFFTITGDNWCQDQENQFLPLPGTYLLLYSIYFELLVRYKNFLSNSILSSNFSYSTTVKPRLSALAWKHQYYHLLPTSSYCHRATNSTENFINVNIVLKGISHIILIYFHFITMLSICRKILYHLPFLNL